jgi:LacI family transcriptional regulator
MVSSPVTLEDVARASGVSPAAASRALNGRRGVRADVRQRVTSAARSLGYRPNRSARHLAGGRSSVIGFVVPSTELRFDPYGASITHAVARAATEADQGLMLVLGVRETGDAVRRILSDGLIDGVLVSSVAAGEGWVEELLSAAIPTVLIGSHPTRADVDVVDVENLQSSARAVEHLIEQGCARIGTITGPLDRVDAQARLAGYRLALSRHGRSVDDDLVALGDFSQQSALATTRLLLERGADAIFAANDEMALGAMAVIHGAGRRVPEDVAVVGFDGTSIRQDAATVLTTVRQPFDEVGAAAVAGLLRRIDGDPTTGRLVIDPELVLGASSVRVSRG